MNENEIIDYYKNTKTGLKGIDKIQYDLPNNKNVKKTIEKLEPYQITRKQTTHKNYIPIVDTRNNSYQADLMFLDDIKTQNKNYSIIFCAIEITSRYAFCFPLKKKDEKTMAECMTEFIKQSGCKYLTTDSGAEFKNKSVKEILKNNGVEIHFYKSNDKQKRGLSIIERFNRTLRGYIVKLIQVTNKLNWVDKLQELVYNYNHSYHSTIKTKPIIAHNNPERLFYIRNRLINKANTELKKDKINIGDIVRIPIIKKTFGKEDINFSKELYKVVDKKAYSYILEDEEGNQLKKRYRGFQLLKTNDIIKNIGDVNKDLKIVRNNHKIEKKLKTEGIDKSLIIEGKRIRKKPDRLNL